VGLHYESATALVGHLQKRHLESESLLSVPRLLLSAYYLKIYFLTLLKG
jgi:hypothetical protein